MSGRYLQEEFSQISAFREAALYGKFYMSKIIRFDIFYFDSFPVNSSRSFHSTAYFHVTIAPSLRLIK